MSDIIKCGNSDDCPIHTQCWRHLAPDSIYAQFYCNFYDYNNWKGDYFECQNFYDKTGDS